VKLRGRHIALNGKGMKSRRKSVVGRLTAMMEGQSTGGDGGWVKCRRE
jgi:hypothetical protein